MAEYTLGEMEQAKRRVMEMQRRSKKYTDGTAIPPAEAPRQEVYPQEKTQVKTAQSSAPNDFLSGLLKGENSDRLLILLVAMLLWGENCDKLLLLALLYCAM